MTPFERACRQYPFSRFTLIPLHRPTDSKSKNGVLRLLGKAPIDKNWTKATYDSEAVLRRCLDEKRNVGIRLRRDQVVIDIDPRNGGDVSYLELFAEFGIDEDMFPRVVTGSGGLHLYATKPKNIPILDTLGDEYPGVEFKSKGRQVVAAGSIHPETKKPYQWSTAHPPIEDAPALPAKLLKLITKPMLSTKIAGGGEYDQETIARMLDHLDARRFSDQKKWLNLMMAVHHASNGDARSEFIEWCITDPQYKNDAALIGRRWDSLHRGKLDGIKSGTLDWYMRSEGATNAIPYKGAKGIAADEFDDPDIDSGVYIEGDEEADAPADDDFDFDTPEDEPKAKPKPPKDKGLDDDGITAVEPYTEASRAMLKELNDKYTWVLEGGKPKVIYSDFDPVLERKFWNRMFPADFEKHYSNKRLERDKKAAGLGANASDTIPLGKAWTEWVHRNQREGIIFLPTSEQMPGYINLWDGWATVPSKKGSWDKLQELMRSGLCGDDEESFEYLMRWCAFMFQYPEQNAEVTVAIRGHKGTGKGTLGNALCKVIGRHALHISSAGHLTGRFNAHLQDCVFLFSDEAILPYDKQAESVLKSLITEPTISVEKKGVDLIQGKNFLHILMASNEKWVVPASFEERRFFVLEACNKYLGNKAFFKSLREELENGGYERMLHDLMAYTLPDDWHPRDVPITQALIDQKVRGLGPVATYFYNAICQKDFGGMPTRPNKGWDWENKPVRFFVQDFKNYFAEYCRSINANPGSQGRSNHQYLMQEIQDLFPGARTSLRDPVNERHDINASPSDNRSPAIEIPSRRDCMASFEAKLGGKPSWPDLEDKGTVRRKPIKPAKLAAELDFDDFG